MEQSGGEFAGAKRASSSVLSGSGGEDRLSALPDDILVLILLLLDTAAAAGRTSILSRRWHRLWALLPELRFPAAPAPHLIASALAAHEAALRGLVVATTDAAPESVAAWLPAAARRLSGRLVFTNRAPGSSGRRDGGGEEEAEKGGAFELPCFGRAAALSFDLGFLSLAVPPAGVFGARLVEISLERVRFAGGAAELGAAVSSPRCPCLQKLSVRDARGLDNLAICSESLLEVQLQDLDGLRRLAVAAPALQDLRVYGCFYQNKPVADISAPQLVYFEWSDPYDPSSVKLGEMAQLRVLFTGLGYLVYGPPDMRNDGDMLGLLKRFPVVRALIIPLVYFKDIRNSQYLMGDITTLPHVTFLNLVVLNKGHAFGASLFHVLRLCSGIRKLLLAYAPRELEAQHTCPSGCICDQQTNWKTEELLLNHLEEVYVLRLKGYEREVPFMKQLFNRAPMLKEVTFVFDGSVSESKAAKFRPKLSRFFRPETRVEFYMSCDKREVKSVYLLVLEDRRSTRWLGVLKKIILAARKQIVLGACTLQFLCVLVYYMLAYPYEMFSASIPWWRVVGWLYAGCIARCFS